MTEEDIRNRRVQRSINAVRRINEILNGGFMKKLVQVQEVEGEGLVSLLGQKVIVFCTTYIYVGTLEGVNGDCILLRDPRIVYETGAFTNKEYKDAQFLGAKTHYVMKNQIESFGVQHD